MQDAIAACRRLRCPRRALSLASSASAAVTAATSVTDANYVDAYAISSNSKVTVSVQLLDWVSSSNYTILSSGNYTLANAVRVTVTYTVPLNFGVVIGYGKQMRRSRSATVMLTTGAAPPFRSPGTPILALR